MAHSPTLARTPLRTADLLPWLAVVAVVLVTGYLLFGGGVVHAATWWATPEYSHSYVVLALSLWVVWQRRHAILAERRVGSWHGVGVVAFGMLVCLAGVAAFMLRLPYMALVITLVGLGIAGLGWHAMRRLWLPVFLLLFTFQLPGSVYVFVSLELQLVSSRLGAMMLELIGIPVFLDGNVIDLGLMQMQVAEACSGLRYLFPLAAFGFICAWLYQAPLWARALVLLSTVPITIVTNSFRIAMTGVFLDFGNLAMAEGFMHLFEGWVVFLLALALLFLLMWGLAKLRDRRVRFVDILDFDRIQGPPATAGAVPERAIGRPLLACLGIMTLVAVGQGPLLEREQYVPERPGLVAFPRALGTWQGLEQPVEQEVLRALGTSDHLMVDYARPGDVQPINLWVAYYATQVDNAAIHSPKDCLPAGGWEFVSITPTTAPLPGRDGEPFQFNRAVITNGPSEMVMYYWLDMRGRKLTNEVYLKFVNLYDSIVDRRSDGALVRLVTAVGTGETVADADRRLMALFEEVYPELAPHLER